MALTDKQIRFCQEYTIDFNATQAAIRASYSPDTARSIGHENLTKPDIHKYIKELQAALSERAQVTKEMLVAELTKVALFDIRNCYDENGAFKKLKDLDDSSAAAIAGIETKEETHFGAPAGETKKIKFHNKIAAIERLSKILGFDAPVKVAPTDSKGNDVDYSKLPDNVLDAIIAASTIAKPE